MSARDGRANTGSLHVPRISLFTFTGVVHNTGTACLKRGYVRRVPLFIRRVWCRTYGQHALTECRHGIMCSQRLDLKEWTGRITYMAIFEVSLRSVYNTERIPRGCNMASFQPGKQLYLMVISLHKLLRFSMDKCQA